ncbi:hypothetical protein [Paenibacillus sinopodophylli]|uniref:hypothetical protein n=1 Tax=Paenibacillus sinopodophylli TaxID=1837342 RepID=UPI00110D0C8A|nr:hypothetical protein [Paenibacillus sinopodophylli]
MLVYGCDFSGAKNPNGKIFVTIGILKDETLTIEKVIECEDRLDLFCMIRSNPYPWGLDFPFAIPREHLNEQYHSSWKQFIAAAYSESRVLFKHKFGKVHSGKNNERDCRITDIAAGGKSPIAETPISMNGMLYGGRKLLFNLLPSAVIYPFDSYREDAARLYEVYPSHGWLKLGIGRADELTIGQIEAAFKSKVDDRFNIKLDPAVIPRQLSGEKKGKLNEHAADSVMACIILAYCIYEGGLDAAWGLKPWFATDEEWNNRLHEGLIVRIE